MHIHTVAYLGDADGDGEVPAADADAINRHVVGLEHTKLLVTAVMHVS